MTEERTGYQIPENKTKLRSTDWSHTGCNAVPCNHGTFGSTAIPDSAFWQSPIDTLVTAAGLSDQAQHKCAIVLAPLSPGAFEHQLGGAIQRGPPDCSSRTPFVKSKRALCGEVQCQEFFCQEHPCHRRVAMLSDFSRLHWLLVLHTKGTAATQSAHACGKYVAQINTLVSTLWRSTPHISKRRTECHSAIRYGDGCSCMHCCGLKWRVQSQGPRIIPRHLLWHLLRY